MVHLRVARARDDEEAPRHFEGVALKAAVRGWGWVIGICSAVGGVVTMVAMAGSAVELAGALAAAMGVIAIFLLVRCWRFETVLTERWLITGAGPLNQRAPLQLKGETVVRAATSWRRLFADREVVIDLPAGSRQVVVPSLEPEELVEVLGGHPPAGHCGSA